MTSFIVCDIVFIFSALIVARIIYFCSSKIDPIKAVEPPKINWLKKNDDEKKLRDKINNLG